MSPAAGTDSHYVFPCRPTDLPGIWEIINESASAYRDVIPADRWHEPYMSMPELESEIARGIRFYGYWIESELVGVMGLQDVKDVTLIRHAYVRTKRRGRGIGTAQAATWAIRFYQRYGFRLTSDAEKNRLLRIYWTVPDRQVEESVVLVDEKWATRRDPPEAEPMGSS